MKTGSRGGYYLRRLKEEFKGEAPRVSEKLMRKNPREYSRRIMIRAVHRRIHDKKKFKKFARWVRGIRKSLGVSHPSFAKMIGVSRVTVVRWQCASGHMPATWTKKNAHGRKLPSNMDRLRELEALANHLKASGTPFEED